MALALGWSAAAYHRQSTDTYQEVTITRLFVLLPRIAVNRSMERDTTVQGTNL